MLEWMTGLVFVWALFGALWWAKQREESRQARGPRQTQEGRRR